MAHIQQLEDTIRLIFRYPMPVAEQELGAPGNQQQGIVNLGMELLAQIIQINATEFLFFIGWESFVPYLHEDHPMANFVPGGAYYTNVIVFLADGDMQTYQDLRDEAPDLPEGVLVDILPPPIDLD